MSTIAISYGSLEDAAEEARTVAKRLDTYRSSLHESVYRKLCSYDISQGAAQVSAKLNEPFGPKGFLQLLWGGPFGTEGSVPGCGQGCEREGVGIDGLL